VNVASRVEALNKDLGSRLLVTEEVWRGAGCVPSAGSGTDEAPVSRDPLQIRGREMPVRIFQLA
jgi:adenylate cyclase